MPKKKTPDPPLADRILEQLDRYHGPVSVEVVALALDVPGNEVEHTLFEMLRSKAVSYHPVIYLGNDSRNGHMWGMPRPAETAEQVPLL